MTLATGTRLGPYEILSPLGAGGMGEVYRARDTRLDRIVAIKVLPDHLSSNAELRQRFEREARAVSSLNHPHICALYDVGHQDGIDYLVMEFIEGSPLSQRLENGALPTEQVLRYAIQIADALVKAHRGGIIHRDLKPGNIMITKTGAKLLDFGLAKLHGGDSTIASSLTSLPTERHSITGQGAILGTFQYMAPEQLEGQEVDARTDIFAFGAVVYEMATGKKAFTGKSQASLITSIMSSDPAPMSTIQPTSPPALDRIAKTCLAKDPDDRWQTAHDVMLQLQWIAEGRSQEAPASKSRLFDNAWLPWTLAAVLLLGVVGFGWAYLARQPVANAHVFKTSIVPPEKSSFGHLALSPDGKWLAFTAATGGKVQLWVRALDSLEAKALASTAGATYPFWSPDSRWIGFFADGRVKKIEVSGGLAQTLCDTPNFLGATWNSDGVILFARGGAGAISRILATGGEAVQLIVPDRARLETNLVYPVFLPDGRHFLYAIRSGQKEIRGVYVGSLDGGVKQRLLSDVTSARYVTAADASTDYGGWLLFGRDDALFCQPFDARRLQLTGEPFSISEHVGHDPKNTDYANFSVSENGVLVFDQSVNRQRRQYLWVDRGGKPAGSLDAVGSVGGPWLSPDEKRFVADRVDPQTNTIDLWLCDVTGKNVVRFTFDPGNDSSPVWSPDGRLIVWGSNREGNTDLYQKAASGAGQDTLLLKSDHTKFPTDWSQDGRFIIYRQADPKTKFDVWVLPVAGTAGKPSGEMKPFPVLQTEASETAATLSPDGRWLAYASDETGRDEIYIQSFPTGGGKKQLSFGGAHSPRWRRDGKELFYYSSDGKLMAVPVESGENFVAGAAVALFEFRTGSSGLAVVPYAVTADGQRFLVNAIVENETAAALTVVSNWTAELKR